MAFAATIFVPILRRLQNAVVALIGIILPLATICLIALAATATTRTSPVEGQTPNPSVAPWYFLGPTELLVYFNPRLAGTIGWWYLLWLPVLGMYIAFVGLAWPTSETSSRAKTWLLATVSLVLGLVFAAPWFYALVQSAVGVAF